MFSFIISIIILIVIWDYMNKKRIDELISRIPGPPPCPIIGCWLIFKVRSIYEIEKLLWEYHNKYGGLLRLFLFNRLGILITRPDCVEAVMGSTKHIKKVYFYDIFRVWLGQGLLVSSGNYWHTRRKVLTPAFHFKILEQFIESFDQQSKIFVEKLSVHSNTGKPFNVHPFIARLTLDTLCEAAMGVKMSAQKDPNCEYVKAVVEATEILTFRVMYHYNFFTPIFKLLHPKMKKRQDAAIKVLHDFAEKVIEERSEQLKKSIANNKTGEALEEEIGIKKRTALLDILLQSTVDGKPLSNQDIREEVDNFMFAGHDTTTAALGFMLYLISRHPHVQEKIVAEIQEVFGEDKEQPLTFGKLLELKYIECVIKETLRLYPSVPAIGRELVGDAIIDGRTIPGGTQILIPIFMMGKNPDIFPDPEKFDPDRHVVDDNKIKMNPYAFIPFSAGPRNCIGQKFAMMEMKSVLCHVLRNYELLPLGEEIKVVLNAILKSENGVNIGIKDRVY